MSRYAHERLFCFCPKGPLVQRELSAELTEGLRYEACFYLIPPPAHRGNMGDAVPHAP